MRRRYLGFGGVGLCGLLLAFSGYMAHRVTRPRRTIATLQAAFAPLPHDVTFRTSDHLTLHGWYFAHGQPRAGVVIAHGYGMDRGEWLELASALQADGFAILLFDFRAHGASEGGRSTIGFREADDVIAAVRFLHTQPALAAGKIGVIGLSMGAVAALGAAAREPLIGAVVADSGYATLDAIAVGGLRLVFGLPPFPFAPIVMRFGELLTQAKIRAARPIDLVGQIAPRPLLFIHGSADRLIPVVQSRRLYAAAREPKALWVVPAVGHVRAFREYPAAYLARVEQFLTAALSPVATVGPREVALAGIAHQGT